jgi:vacuolar-type H+-ATPase subunit E/Vma4
MPLEGLVEEIRRRGEAELAGISRAEAAELAKVDQERDRRIAALREEARRSAEREAARLRAQRRAAAKLAARKLVYEAREARLQRALDETRALLAKFTTTPAYTAVLKRMIATASTELGRGVKIVGREEDATTLGRLAGKAFDPAPAPILGGIVAETPDGRRRLNLSFDELLRLRADRVRELFR